MGLKCFSQNAESFPLEYRVWKHDLHRFSQKFSPKNEAGDSYKKNSYIKKRCKKNSYKNGVFPGSSSVISRLRISTRLKLNSFKNRKSVNIPFLCNRLIHRSVFVKVDWKIPKKGRFLSFKYFFCTRFTHYWMIEALVRIRKESFKNISRSLLPFF